MPGRAEQQEDARLGSRAADAGAEEESLSAATVVAHQPQHHHHHASSRSQSWPRATQAQTPPQPYALVAMSKSSSKASVGAVAAGASTTSQKQVATPASQRNCTRQRSYSLPSSLNSNGHASTPVTPPYMPSGRHHSFFEPFLSEIGLDGAGEQQEPQGASASGQLKKQRTGGGGGGGADEAGGEDAGSAEVNTTDAAGDDSDSSRPMSRSASIALPPLEDAARPRRRMWSLLSWGPADDLPLYHFSDLPSWQRYAPCIRGGYRAFYNTPQCLRSLFGWHNESINVWSHGVGFIGFVAATVTIFCTTLRTPSGGFNLGAARTVYALFSLGSLACMLNSAVYHLFTGHCSRHVMTIMGRLDFLGITALIVGSFLPPLYTMFHCSPRARNFYMGLIIVLGAAGAVGPWTAVFHRSVALRTSVFLGMGLSGILPGVHTLLLLPVAAVPSALVGIGLMVLFYIGGVVFYVTRFPESHFPGKFDCFLSSHQIWHFLVLAAAIVHFANCGGMYQMWKLMDGAC